MDDASLMEIGVLDAQHRSQLTEAAKLLATPRYKMDSNHRPTNLDDWLGLLRLGHYAEQFRKNCFDDIERIERIWEVELTTVVEIRLVGHLRRILVSLRRDGAKDVQQQPSVLYPRNEKELSSLSSDLQKIVSRLVPFSMFTARHFTFFFGRLQSTNLAELGNEIDQKISETNGTLSRKSTRAPLPPSSFSEANYRQASYQALEQIIDGLAVRNPSELVIGIAKQVATHWRHQPHELLKPGVSYEAQVTISGREIE